MKQRETLKASGLGHSRSEGLGSIRSLRQSSVQEIRGDCYGGQL